MGKYSYNADKHWDVFKWAPGKCVWEPIADNAKWVALPPSSAEFPNQPRWFSSWQAAMDHIDKYGVRP